jgi:hypothetical protein
MAEYTVTDPQAAMAKAAAHKEAETAAAKTETVRAVEHSDTTTTKSHTVTRPPGVSFARASGTPIGGAGAGPGDVVHLGELATNVENAERLGLIERDGEGWRATAKGLEAAGEKAAPSSDSADPHSADPEGQEGQQDGAEDQPEVSEAVQQAAEIIDALPSGTFERAAASALANPGAVDPATLATLATELGVDEAEVTGKWNKVVSGFEGEAAEYLKETHGVSDGDGFVAWASARRPEEFKQAMMAQVRGELEAYDALALEFRSVAAALDASDLSGYDGEHEVDGSDDLAEVWTEADGRTWFHHPKTGSLLLRTAMLRGLVRPS